jgi:hypothetical protein
LRLNYLALEIVITILDGRQPEGVTATKLIADTLLPLEWSAQRREMGLPAGARYSRPHHPLHSFNQPLGSIHRLGFPVP